jgi:hypothetical protein
MPVLAALWSLMQVIADLRPAWSIELSQKTKQTNQKTKQDLFLPKR